MEASASSGRSSVTCSAWRRRGANLVLVLVLVILASTLPLQGSFGGRFHLLLGPSIPWEPEGPGAQQPPRTWTNDFAFASPGPSVWAVEERTTSTVLVTVAATTGAAAAFRGGAAATQSSTTLSSERPPTTTSRKATTTTTVAVRTTTLSRKAPTTTAVAARPTLTVPPRPATPRRQCKLRPVQQGCNRCCNDGEKFVPCLDAEACAAKAPAGGRYAFVLAQVGKPGWPWLAFIGSMRAQADKLAADANGSVDILLMIPPQDAARLEPKHRELLAKHGVRVLEVAWTIPPSLRWWPEDWWPGKALGWCGPQDLVRLHALGLDDYSAVAFYDQDVEFQGDVGPVLRCAATGYFLSTSGGVGTPLNIGFFAVRPDRRLLRAADLFAGNASFGDETGWANSGFAPSRSRFVGAECGQGFFHTLLYKERSAVARNALEAAGLVGPTGRGMVTAAQVDKCIWNYQTAADCPQRYDCGRIRAHHKPGGKPQGRDCPKLAYRLTPAPTPPPPPEPKPEDSLRPCVWQPVPVGANCKCQGANYIKHIPVHGVVRACDAVACNPSGDVFSITFSGKILTATREYADSCWCDGDVDVLCCVDPP